MRVTQHDIARIASVSQATVSRVLAGDEKVEIAVRERVLAAATRHNYRPDVRARSLRSQRTGLIGLVVQGSPDRLADDPFFSTLVAEILQVLAPEGYHLCLDLARSDSDESTVYDELLRSRRVDGVILVESEASDRRIQMLCDDRFPFVLIGNPGSAHVPSVDNDNVAAAETAAAHLLDAGYGRVGILAARRGVTVSDDRVAGYQRAIRLRQNDHLIWHADFGFDAARSAALDVLVSEDRPDALVVLDDFMAMGVVSAARRVGLRVGRDLGLVSFNDSHLCALLEGGLSSVDLRIGKMVRAACNLLLDHLKGQAPEDAPRVLVPCQLKARASSCPEVSA